LRHGKACGLCKVSRSNNIQKFSKGCRYSYGQTHRKLGCCWCHLQTNDLQSHKQLSIRPPSCQISYNCTLSRIQKFSEGCRYSYGQTHRKLGCCWCHLQSHKQLSISPPSCQISHNCTLSRTGRTASCNSSAVKNSYMAQVDGFLSWLTLKTSYHRHHSSYLTLNSSTSTLV